MRLPSINDKHIATTIEDQLWIAKTLGYTGLGIIYRGRSPRYGVCGCELNAVFANAGVGEILD